MSKLTLLFCFVLSSFSPFYDPTPHGESGNDDTSCLSYIPSAISPNGDGINDVFVIRHSCLATEMTLDIFDQQGHLLVAIDGPQPQWNGLVRGVPVPAGKYSWILSYHVYQGRDVSKTGNLVVIR